MKRIKNIILGILSLAIVSSTCYVPAVFAENVSAGYDEISNLVFKEYQYRANNAAYDIKPEEYIEQTYGKKSLERIRYVNECILFIDDTGVVHSVITELTTVVEMKSDFLPPVDTLLKLYEDGKIKSCPTFCNLYNSYEDVYSLTSFFLSSEEESLIYETLTENEDVHAVREMTLIKDYPYTSLSNIIITDGITNDDFYKEYGDVLKLVDSRVLSNMNGVPISEYHCEVKGFFPLWMNYEESDVQNVAKDALIKLFESNIQFELGNFGLDTGVYPYEPTDEILEKYGYIGEKAIENCKNSTEETKYLIERSKMLSDGRITLEDIERVQENLNNEKYTSNPFNIGDINADGKADISDLSELAISLVGDKELTESQRKAADVDSDGAVKLADLAKFRQFLSKQISSLG